VPFAASITTRLACCIPLSVESAKPIIGASPRDKVISSGVVPLFMAMLKLSSNPKLQVREVGWGWQRWNSEFVG